MKGSILKTVIKSNKSIKTIKIYIKLLDSYVKIPKLEIIKHIENNTVYYAVPDTTDNDTLLIS